MGNTKRTSVKIETFLAVDPGKSAGYAVFDGGVPVEWGKARGDTVLHVKALVDDAYESGCDALVIEDQFPGKVMGWKATRTLIRRAMLWVVAWELATSLGPDSVHWVHPASWQAKLLGGRLKSEARKRMAVEWVSATFQFNVGFDEASAIAVGYYWQQWGRCKE